MAQANLHGGFFLKSSGIKIAIPLSESFQSNVCELPNISIFVLSGILRFSISNFLGISSVTKA